MSAITGIFRMDGLDVDPVEIKKMNDILAHRGPDGSRTWCEGSVALGHQMLHTTPESLHEMLPFEDEESGLVITADARIDNRKELSKELSVNDKENVSDSYFILKAYEKWGEKCPEKLLGDFAFGIWDKKAGIIFTARDHMGIKPFYYYLSDDVFVFGTEIKALLHVKGVPFKLNEQRAACYLMDIDDNKSTFYEKIHRFEPANSLTIDQANIKKRRYWKLDPESTINMDSDEEYARKYLEIFKDAIKCRLRSAFPTGFELSGGLDSSSIVCTAKKLLSEYETDLKVIDTFSIVSDDFPPIDERYYIKKVSETGGIVTHFILCDEVNLIENMETILRYQEEPFFTPFMTVLWKFYQEMQEKGKRIVLTGVGGDAVVSYGSHYFHDLAVNFKWKKIISELKLYSKNIDTSALYLFYYEIISSLIPDLFKQRFNRIKSDEILNKGFRIKTNSFKLLNDLYWEPNKIAKNAKTYHYQSITTDHLYMTEMLDRTTAAFQIELRYPFLDKRMVEYCYAIPTEMKFKSGWSRYISRIAMEGILPAENQWRLSKGGIEPMLENFMLSEEHFIYEVIDAEKLEKFVDLSKIRDIYQKFKEGKSGYDLFYLWFVLLFYLWSERTEINYD